MTNGTSNRLWSCCKIILSDSKIMARKNVTNWNFISKRCSSRAQPMEYGTFVSVLSREHFSPEQIDRIAEYFEKKPNICSHLNEEVIREVMEFWRGIAPGTGKSHSVSRKMMAREDLNYVIGNVEPSLLCVSIQDMAHRVESLKGLGILTGRADMYRLLCFSPAGFFLQNWPQLLQKYYYIQYKIMDWVLGKKKDRYPIPHPLVKYPEVIEQTYDHLKTRHLFAVKTGLKTGSSVLTGGISKQINLQKLFLSEPSEYLKWVAPWCTEEELLVFEQLVTVEEDDEDEIMMNLAELGGSKSSIGNRKHKTNKPWDQDVQETLNFGKKFKLADNLSREK